MPVRKRKDLRREEVTDEHEAWLHGDDKAAGFIKYATAMNWQRCGKRTPNV
jgi:hypothetical protein